VHWERDQNTAPGIIHSQLSEPKSYTSASNLEFIIQSILGTSLTSLGLDEQVDKEKAWKQSSEKDGRESLDDGVHGEGRGSQRSGRDGSSGSLDEGGLGDWRRETGEVR